MTVEGQRSKKRRSKKKNKGDVSTSFSRTCYLATLERTHDGSLAVGCSYSSHRAVTRLLTALGGDAATVPWVDGDGPAFRNFTIVNYRQEFEVGEMLLKAVYYRLIEDRCESNRLLEVWNKDCMVALLPQEESFLAEPAYSNIERAAASAHISLRDLLDYAYNVIHPVASSDLRSVKESVELVELVEIPR